MNDVLPAVTATGDSGRHAADEVTATSAAAPTAPFEKHEGSSTRQATWWGIGLGALGFFPILFDLRFDPLRTATETGIFANFFDLQASAFLKGHLWVPDGSLAIEGFVVRGHTYTYFPPLPALLRVPVQMLTHGFDGRLTLLSMALAWVVFAVMTARLFWLVRDLVVGTPVVSRIDIVVGVLLIAGTTGGSVVAFDASLPWVYHEVYLWAVALVVGALYWLIRVGLDPTRQNILRLSLFTLAAILTRTTGGWALCFAIMATAGWIATGRPRPDRRRASLHVFVAGLVPLVIAAGFNWIKFRHPYLFPLQDQVWTSVNAHRREALAHNGGTITGPQFLPTTVINYFRPDGIRFVGQFPWVTLPPHPAKAYAGALLDQSYRTGSVTSFMTTLFAFSLWSFVVVLRRKASLAVRSLRIPLFGALAVAGGIMAYGYVTYRYTSEFIPFLALGSAIGAFDVTRRMRNRSVAAQGSIKAVIAIGIAVNAFSNAAVALPAARLTERGAPLVQYVSFQRWATRSATAKLVTHSATLPASGRTDELRIVGDCDGLYLGTGDDAEPWVAVQMRDWTLDVAVGDTKVSDGRTRLIRAMGNHDRYVDVQRNRDYGIRFLIVDNDGPFAGPWLTAKPGHVIHLTVHPRPELGFFELNSDPGGLVGYVYLTELRPDGVSRTGSMVRSDTAPGAGRSIGLSFTSSRAPVPALCGSLARDAGIHIG